MPDLALVQRGQACAEIFLAGEASPPEAHAAAELQAHLEQISGAKLPIVSVLSDSRATVLIGRSSQSERLLRGFQWDSLKEDGCLVRSAEQGLVLAGATPRGTLYAVYEFLERCLGCRWLTPGCNVIPRRSSVIAGRLDETHVPPFRYREPYFSVVRDPDWAARNRANGSSFPLDAARGGKWNYAGFVHTFYPLLPPEQYFAEHPEYFSEVGGVRLQAQGQLCLTNPAVVDRATQSARQWLRNSPEARIISISQNDWGGNCQCPECRKVDEAEGSPAGSLVRFVNAIAERLEGDFPHVLFDTLAYTYTIRPPRTIRPRRNVVIRLCHMMPCCDGHSLQECSLNRDYVDILHRWCAISPELFVWDYFNNFSHYFMPFPNLDAICADIPLYAEAGVTGVFCQGDAGPDKGCGDMAELRAYLLAKLLWRPEQDGQALIDEFLRLYYGPAAEPIRDYLDLLHNQIRGRNVHFHLYAQLDAPFLSQAIMARAEKLFDEAERRVRDDAELADRVAAARLPIEYVRWKHNLRFAVRKDRYELEDAQLARRVERFFSVATAHGAKSLREGGRPIADDAAGLRGFDLLTLQREGLRLVVAPAIGGRILSLTDPVTSQEWTHVAAPEELDYPVAGGYEEYSEALWRRPGWSEPYRVISSDPAIELSAELANDVTLKRSYRIEASSRGPSLIIESTLANPGAETRRVSFRSHPELDPADFAELAVMIKRPDGTVAELAPWRNSTDNAGDLWLQGDQLPAGEWALRRGTRKLTIEFNPSGVARCLIGWERNARIVRLEMFGVLTDLAPGGSMTLRQRWTLERS